MKTLWLTLCLLNIVGLCYADRDIVYSARYYAPPGSHRTSHFHIYRINPDGTGKTQLTFGSRNDYRPKWSPDGRHILFARADTSLCVIGANGGALHTLLTWSGKGNYQWVSFRWMPGGKAVIAARKHIIRRVGSNGKPYVWDVLPDAVYLFDIRKRSKHRVPNAVSYLPSPDGKYAYITNGSGGFVREIASGTDSALQYSIAGDSVWLDNKTLSGLIGGLEFTPTVGFLGRDGREKGAMALALPAPYSSTYLWGTPNPRRVLIYVIYHERTAGADCLFYRFAPNKGNAMYLNAAYLTEGQFLAWSPDSSHFCIAPGRLMVPSKKPPAPSAAGKGGAVKKIPDGSANIWVAPLYIRATGGGKMRQLTPRLSWVTFADWRKGN